MKIDADKLDNPTWYSLTEAHKDFAIEYNSIKFYHPAYCPFGGFINPATIKDGIDEYALLTNNFYVVGNRPIFNNKVQLKKELVCHQMFLDKPINVLISEQIIELQTANQKAELFDLVNLVQPGYFNKKTASLGNYFGVYKDGKLIAATGERMQMNEYSEVSAVVTHPDHIGKGYAKQLLTYTSNNIFNNKKIPYLHVTDTNTGAIGLYEKLGFWTRRKISFWNLITNNNTK